MLDLVENILRNNGYYLEDELRNIVDTPCSTSTIKVLKFDQIKEDTVINFVLAISLGQMTYLFFLRRKMSCILLK